MGVRARFRAVCVVANPRNSQAIAVVCASQPIPNRIPHTFIRDHEHVLSQRQIDNCRQGTEGVSQRPAEHRAGESTLGTMHRSRPKVLLAVRCTAGQAGSECFVLTTCSTARAGRHRQEATPL